MVPVGSRYDVRPAEPGRYGSFKTLCVDYYRVSVVSDLKLNIITFHVWNLKATSFRLRLDALLIPDDRFRSWTRSAFRPWRFVSYLPYLLFYLSGAMHTRGWEWTVF
jgi:hypothetical protein